MKALLGLLQIGLGIAGLVALFNGQWLVLILCWAGAFFVGFLGSRAVRAVDGVSQGGQEVLGNISGAIEQLRQGRYQSANGLAMGAVSQFRIGGDKCLLVPALTIQSVTMAATGDNDGARKALSEAGQRIAGLPPAMAIEAQDMRSVLSLIDSELSQDSPDPDRIVRRFLEFNDQN